MLFVDPVCTVEEPKPRPALRAIQGLQQPGEAMPAQGNLFSVPDCIETDQVPNEAPEVPQTLISADTVSELFAKRQAAAQRARAILAKNSHKLHNGRAEEVPTSVDALGTVRQVVAVKREFGINSPQYKRVFPGLVLDNERLLGEAVTKNQSEYFARVCQTLQSPESPSRGFLSHGLSISKMTENGLSPLTRPEEQMRRVNDFVEEEGTYVPIGNMIANHGLRAFVELLPIPVEPETPQVNVQVTTISECTDFAEREYAINSKGSFEGYRPGMKGIAIRRLHFEHDSGDRDEEQAIISGIYITHDLIEEFLAEKGALDKGQKMTKNELHGTQFISVNGGGVMEFVKELDDYAGAKLGLNLFNGEQVPANHPKDYVKFMEQAEERRKQLAPMPTQLAEYQIELEESGVDSRTAEALVNKFLKDKLLAIAKAHPELAEVMFDSETAQGFAEVARLEAAGQYEEAYRKQLTVEKNAPEVSYCGAGGCADLENVDPSSPVGQLAMRLGLRGKMVRNTASACTNCKAKELYHDYNGNTVCVSCKSTKLSGQHVKHNQDKVVSIDEQRKKSKKTAARQKTPAPEKPGKVLQLKRQPPKNSPPAA